MALRNQRTSQGARGAVSQTQQTPSLPGTECFTNKIPPTLHPNTFSSLVSGQWEGATSPYSYRISSCLLQPPVNTMQEVKQGHEERGSALLAGLLCGSLETCPKAEALRDQRKYVIGVDPTAGPARGLTKGSHQPCLLPPGSGCPQSSTARCGAPGPQPASAPAGRGSGRMSVKAGSCSAHRSRWPLAPEPHHNPSSSLRVTWQGACKPLSTNGLSSDKREKQAQSWSAGGTSICSWEAVDDPSGPGQLLGAAEGEPASALPPAVTKETRHTATLPPWNEKLSSKQTEIPRPGRGHI